jgi:hypothetical protein
VNFLQRKSVLVHGLPGPRPEGFGLETKGKEGKDGKSVRPREERPIVKYKPVGEASFSESAACLACLPRFPCARLCSSALPDHYVCFLCLAGNEKVEFSTNTMRSDYLSQMPDVIIYVSKKGARDKCVGYLRIPLNGVKRPTENWEHGEDLTIFPAIWEEKTGSARCLALKPLKELYEAMSGFLLFRLTMTKLSAAEVKDFQVQTAPAQMSPVKRQKYKFVANIYQAKELASVESSGLSSPFATVRFMDLALKTKPRMQTCYPLWFESVEAMIVLPENLQYAPDIVVNLFNYVKDSIFKWNDPSIFMGKVEIAATVDSRPHWYPLAFEEHYYGQGLFGFKITPEKDLTAADLTSLSDLTTMVDRWETWAVDVSALAMRGAMATKFARGSKDAVYQLECWGDVQQFSQSQAAESKLTVMIRRPEDPIYYSSINVRVYDGKDLQAVTSIPVDVILRAGMSWYKLIDVSHTFPACFLSCPARHCRLSVAGSLTGVC